MKNVTSVLSEEHQNILKFIDVILNECEQIGEGKELDKSFFENAIDFIKNYADAFHHAKEEKILFEAMLQNLENMHCNPIPVMFHEHETGREYVKGIEEGLAENNLNKTIENAKAYCYLLEQHIDKENNVLYPMAEQALSDAEKDEIIIKYNEVERNTFTKEEISKYLSLITVSE